jgi:GT2 family glycosyltransferase
MQNTFGIGIPTLNRYDLLLPALHFYALNDFPQTEIHIIDNGDQGIENKYGDKVKIYNKKEENLSVAGSWNRLCQNIFANSEYALILNDDIYLGRKQYEIEILLNQHRHDFYLSMCEWSVFIIPRKTYIKIGMFDEEFSPAYYEDNDYEYRMKLAGIRPFKIPFLNPVVYKNSQTMEKNPALLNYSKMNKSRYESKWGGLPNQEKYKSPYNFKK